MVRWAAARVLGDIGPEAKIAIPAFTELCKDKHSFEWDAAAKALEKIKCSHGKEKKQ
jgi:HEAT repeat protein